MKDRDIDEAVAAYTRELVDEAEIAKGDLDEIEDHLRALTCDLRERGMPATVAVTEAARRLGDPRVVAREHARVHPAFGAKLSRFRAYSAALLLVPMLAYMAIVIVPRAGLASQPGVQLVLGAFLAVGLVMRLSWARPILFGGLAFCVVESAVTTYMFPNVQNLPWLVGQLGILAFVMPWRRRELTAAGWALALQVWGYVVATFCLMFVYTDSDGSYLMIAPIGMVAAGFAVLATCGTVLRARWSSFASVLSAVTLAVTLSELWGLRVGFGESFFYLYIVGSVASGMLAATASAILSWRTARSTLGTFQYVLR